MISCHLMTTLSYEEKQMKIIETRSAIKIFYYLLAIDGTIDEVELGHFRSIGMSIDPTHFIEYSEELESECRRTFINAEDDYYDLISEAVDESLTHEAKDDDQGITPRLLLWDLFAAAFSNKEYDESEKRLINHVARKVNVDKDVVLEMEQMMNTLTSIQNEIDWAQQTDRPYSEIRPIVEELEKRQNVITESAEYLIADEIDADNPYEYKPDFFDKTKAKIDETVKPVTDKIGETVKPVTDKVGQTVKPVTDKVGAVVTPVAQKVGDGAVKTAKAASEKLAPVATNAKDKTVEMFGKLTSRFNRKKNEDSKEGN